MQDLLARLEWSSERRDELRKSNKSLADENDQVRARIEELKQKIQGYEKSNYILMASMNKALHSKLL